MHQTASKPPEPILLAAVRISTFDGQRPLTGARGFFFEREDRLFLVTSWHVRIDEPSRRFPDRIEIELHTQLDDLTRSTGFSMLLYREGKSVWRDGTDGGEEIDVAVIEINRAALPQPCMLQAFKPAHRFCRDKGVRLGKPQRRPPLRKPAKKTGLPRTRSALWGSSTAPCGSCASSRCQIGVTGACLADRPLYLMSCELELLTGCPFDWPGCAASANP